MKAAVAAFRESMIQGQSKQSIHTVLLAMSSLAEIQIAAGLLHQAYEQLEQATLMANERGSNYVPLTYLIFMQKGEIHYEWNQLEAAEHYLKKGLELGNELGPQNQTLARYLVRGHLALASVLCAQGKEEEAHDFLAQACTLIWQAQLNYFTAQVAETQMLLWRLPGSPPGVSEWAIESGLSVFDMPETRCEHEYLTLIRFLMRQGQLQGVQELLERLRQNAQAGGL